MIEQMLRDSPYLKRRMLRATVTESPDFATFGGMFVALRILLVTESLLLDLLEGKVSSAEP